MIAFREIKCIANLSFRRRSIGFHLEEKVWEKFKMASNIISVMNVKCQREY